MQRKGNPMLLLVEMYIVTTTIEEQGSSKNLRQKLRYASKIPLFSLYVSNKIKTKSQKEIVTTKFIVTLFTVVKI